MPKQDKPAPGVSAAELKRLRVFTENLAREAGAALASMYVRPRAVTKKGLIDLVTSADLKSERLIINRIQSNFPEHDILSEERGRIDRDSPFRWVIDPLDGTVNFAHGYPQFCVSLGLQYDGESVVGVVCDPLRAELFSAVRGGGARLNGRRIQVTQAPTMVDALCGTGFPYDTHTSRRNNLANFGRVMKAAQDIRRGGSAALDLCYLACGRLDAYWELKLSPWDTAAGALIAREAGALVTDFSGAPHHIDKKEIAAANPILHKELLKLVR
ncbi:MAG TPA: inositol monophosphatase family protein [candidate division Zixibacteria bacterium]|nr:inositol monophosphatase family protein [candidate division Zixibacteria bacterium]